MGLGRSLIVVMLAACAACTLLVDTGDLAGGAPTGLVADGGDTRTGDAVAPIDATDGSDAATACPGALCESFDRPDPLAAWSQQLKGDGALSIANDLSVSAPSSLLVSASQRDVAVAFLEKSFPAHRIIHLRADVRVDRDPNIGGYATLLEIYLDPAPDKFSNYFCGIGLSGGKLTLNAYSTPTGGEASDIDAVSDTDGNNRWMHLDLELDLGAGRARMYEDGKMLREEPMPVVPATRASVFVGLSYVNVPFTERVDNVEVTLAD